MQMIPLDSLERGFIAEFRLERFTIDAEPVRYGRVIVHEGFEDEYYEYCSECGSRDVHIGDNYCSECGAKMDGEQ